MQHCAWRGNGVGVCKTGDETKDDCQTPATARCTLSSMQMSNEKSLFELKSCRWLRASGWLAVCVCGSVAGCGGSGGVGEEPTAIARQLTLTDSNARAALQVSFAPVEFSVYAAELVSLVAEILTLFLQQEYQLACPQNPAQFATMTHVDNDNDHNISRGDLLRWSDHCLGPESGSEVELSVERAVVAPFDVDEITGRVEFSLSTSAGGIEGTFALAYSAVSARVWSLTDVTVASSITELTGSTSATGIDKTVIDGRRYAIEADGRTESDRLGGAVRFTTEDSFSGIQGRFPKEGAFLLSANESKIRVTPATDRELVREYAQYEVDTSGSGEYGPATTLRWDSFLSGLLVNLTPNEPHELVDITIMPEAPDTTDDLTVAYEVSNPDDDELFVRYEWRRNGRLIDGYDYDALPSEETSKGDVIEVALSISDGIVDITDSASTTIVDAPPVVSVANAPDVVEHGDEATFRAAASDPDGDGVGELAFLIEHGPADMTVDPVTGEVSWVADEPMFERSMDVGWGVTVDVAGAQATTGTIRVNDPSRELPLFRSDTNVPRSSDAMRIGDFDGDGRNEALIAGGVLHELESHGDAYRQSWAHPYLWTYVLATGDIDGDGRHEIFAQTAGTLVRLDGVERRVESSVEITVHNDGRDVQSVCMNLELADLDNNGSMELVCLASRVGGRTAVVVLGADDFEEVWRSDIGYGLISRVDYLKVGNVDEDDALEIVTARIGGNQSDVSYVYDGSSGEVEWLFEGGFGREIELADVSGDGVQEIFATGRSGIVAYDAMAKKPIGEIEHQGSPTMAAADITGDDIDDIFLVSHGKVEAYRYSFGGKGFEKIFELTSRANSGFADASRVGDVDNDGVDELLWSARSGYESDELAIVELGRSPANEWSSFGTDLDGPFVGGQVIRSDTGESRHGFATATTNDLRGGTRIVSIGASAEIAVSEDLGPNGKDSVSIFVSDYDHDATDEMFVRLGGRAGVFDPFTGVAEWTTPTMSVVGLTGGDFNDDQRDDLVVLGYRTASVFSVSIFDVFRQMLIGEFDEAPSGKGPKVAQLWPSSMKKNGPVQLQFTDRNDSNAPSDSNDGTGTVSIDALHVGGLNPRGRLEVFDLEGDGSPEILVSQDYDIAAYSKAPGSDSFVRILFYEVSNTSIDDFAVGDVDGDGEFEVFLAVSDRVWRLDSNFEFQKELIVPGVNVRSIMIEQTPELRKNLVAIGRNRFVVADPETGAEIWRSPNLNGLLSRGGVRFHEADSFGRGRVSVGTSAGMYITR